MTRRQRLYDSSPVWLQNLAVTAYGFHLRRKRHGPGAAAVREQVRSCRSWSSDQVTAYQDAAFARILDCSFGTVAHYQEVFREHGLSRHDISGIRDLGRLPLLQKETVRSSRGTLQSNAKVTYWSQHTSGSTGTPVSVDLDRWTYQLTHALLAEYEESNGVGERALRATFAGRLVQPVSRMKAPFWRYNRAERQLLFSSYHLNEQTLPLYIQELTRWQPAEIIGYPSAISIVAEFLLRNGLVGSIRPRVVITNSETLLLWQREMIGEALRCPVRDYYGSAESVIFAAQCREGAYHVHPLLGIAEVLDRTGQPADEGMLVCTTLTNTAMPLIRYVIGDTAVRKSGQCRCGSRWAALSRVVGRVDDVIVTPDGRRIGRVDHIFKGLRGIRECQVVQDAPDRLVLKIVGAPEGADTEPLVRNLEERVGPGFQIDIEMVDHIPRTAAGKFRGVINRIGLTEGGSAVHRSRPSG